MSDYEEQQMIYALESNGMEYIDSSIIGGPFIPDGTHYIVKAGTSDEVASGRSLKEAFDSLSSSDFYRY